MKNYRGESVLLKVEFGVLEGCYFKECTLNVKLNAELSSKSNGFSLIENGAIIFVKNVKIKKCKIKACTSEGEGAYHLIVGQYAADYQSMHTIFCEGGSIESCEFHECITGGMKRNNTRTYNFIINAIGAMERNNTFTDCQAQANVGSAVWRS